MKLSVTWVMEHGSLTNQEAMDSIVGLGTALAEHDVPPLYDNTGFTATISVASATKISTTVELEEWVTKEFEKPEWKFTFDNQYYIHRRLKSIRPINDLFNQVRTDLHRIIWPDPEKKIPNKFSKRYNSPGAYLSLELDVHDYAVKDITWQDIRELLGDLQRAQQKRADKLVTFYGNILHLGSSGIGHISLQPTPREVDSLAEGDDIAKSSEPMLVS